MVGPPDGSIATGSLRVSVVDLGGGGDLVRDRYPRRD